MVGEERSRSADLSSCRESKEVSRANGIESVALMFLTPTRRGLVCVSTLQVGFNFFKV